MFRLDAQVETKKNNDDESKKVFMIDVIKYFLCTDDSVECKGDELEENLSFRVNETVDALIVLEEDIKKV